MINKNSNKIIFSDNFKNLKSCDLVFISQDIETDKRLHTWCTRGKTKPFGEYAIQGALAGKAYGEENRTMPENLRKINDFDWLLEKFNGNT